ncbi:transcriptional regulator [Xenorhabdus bovienii]|uniref:transcriptional regulator n=1 Tax=Xenorhabdus bovienii TaxID=40576 RepID=UPI0023B2C9A7|nr:transcriptional regulator [Xenorhabdus bovienii]MDE9453240.1 transcriptional regulator [Xenorhabdus bovienii]
MLLQSEYIDYEYSKSLASEINKQKRWTSVIPVESRNLIVMDGNHRLHAASLLNLMYLPVVRLYYNSPCVKIFEWDYEKEYNINIIYSTIKNGKTLPYKTTRHLFTPNLPHIDIPLSILRGKNK